MSVVRLLSAAALGLATAGALPAHAEYPDKPVKMYVGFAPGGATDLLARFYAEQLSSKLGQPFIVENRPGAGGNVAIQSLAQTKPDGYTIAMGANYIASNAALKRNAYDWDKDLTPIALIASTPNILVVPPNSPFKSVGDIIQAATRPNAFLTFGSAGVGSSIHLSGELFKAMTGAKLTHVPYKGVSPAEVALMGGDIDMMFGSVSTEVPLVQAGKLKVLAITGLERMKVFPDVPTLDEAGLKGFNVGASYVLVAPARVPDAVVQRLSQAVAEINAGAEAPAYTERLYASPMKGGPAEAKAFLQSEYEKWNKLVADNALKLD
ncbi:tripartite tricarboxylate transporter substrate binding protein [Achromobacter sp. NPDC058515]|uniref:tripartite tricarboxylate transporter substrate binding protein n=1 Tax=Achromobacter sp. NPDC058515 TaxID=3346533 RepID=UPI00364DA50A